MPTTFKSLALTALFAVGTLALIDLAIQQVRPIDHKLEVADGIAQLLKADPEILVVGSSYSRTFHVLGQHLAAATGRETPLVSIPLESGKLIPYDWLIENRLRPIIDKRDPSGQPVYRNLQRFILLTEWWDTCAPDDGFYWNLPALAWDFPHYVADVASHGANNRNRNYVQYQLRQQLWFSALVRDRTEPLTRDAVARFIKRLPTTTRTQAETDKELDAWRRRTEKGVDCIGDPVQMAALDRILDFAAERGLETTVILFPMMPGTITPLANATTLTRAREIIEERVAPRGLRLIDWTLQTPLTDDDFMADFDHVNATGNDKLSRWALEHDLSFLLQPAGSGNAEASRQSRYAQ
jgi:hypothetical protein